MKLTRRVRSTGCSSRRPAIRLNGQLVPPLLDLVDRRLIRVLDALVLINRGEGDFDALTTDDLDLDHVGEIGALAGASSGLLSDDDAATAAAAMTPNSVGLLIVYENLWSLPFAAARARPAGNSSPTVMSTRRRSWPHSTRSNHDEGRITMGLIGGMARTAVIAGTATAVGNRVSRRQANRWSQKDQSAYAQPQYAQPQPQYQQPQYVQPQYQQPQYQQPQYAPPQYVQPAGGAAPAAAPPRHVRATPQARRVP